MEGRSCGGKPTASSRATRHIQRKKLAFLAKDCLLAGARVLHFYCGAGSMSEALARRGARVTAIDSRVELLNSARDQSEARGYRITYRLMPPVMDGDLPVGHGGYDVVLCDHVLDWHRSKAAVLGAAHAALRPGGTLMLSGVSEGLRGTMALRMAREALLSGGPRRRRSRFNRIDAGAVHALMSDTGFEVQCFAGLGLRGYDLSRRHLTYRLTDTLGGIYVGTAKKPLDPRRPI